MKIAMLFLLALLALPSLAREAPSAVADPVLEARAMKLAAELRCLVCQNQSLAESHADLAMDLKEQVRAQLREGRTDAQIRDYMVQRYGDFVLYSPPLKATTVMLWAGPFILLLAGATGLVVYLRRRRGKVVQSALGTEERARARALLEGDGRG